MWYKFIYKSISALFKSISMGVFSKDKGKILNPSFKPASANPVLSGLILGEACQVNFTQEYPCVFKTNNPELSRPRGFEIYMEERLNTAFNEMFKPKPGGVDAPVK